MPRERHRSTSDPQWLGLGEASRLLGVSAATIRRWSDAGRLKVFTTPGGHRRFSRAGLERLLPTERDGRPGLTAGGLTPARLSRAYRREAPTRTGGGWLATLDPERRAAFGELGRGLAWALIAHLDAREPDERTRHLAEASGLAAAYGRMGADLDLSMSDVVEGFLAFRRPFLAELAATSRRRGFDAAEVTGLHVDADRALDHLLVETMSGHRSRSVRPPGGDRPSSRR